MKIRWLMVAAVLLPTLGLPSGYTARNPAIRNPIGIGTAPVSSYSNSLIRSPDPIDATADLSVTGNLRDGKHFRGNVPYRSASDIGLDPSASSLNSHRGTPSLRSFLRDAAGYEDFGRRSPAGYAPRPYYSPDESVARTVPGRQGVVTPTGTDSGFGIHQRQRSTTSNVFSLEPMQKQNVQSEQRTTTPAGFQRFQTQYGQLSESGTESEGVFDRGISTGLRNTERLTPGQVAAVQRQSDKSIKQRPTEQSRIPLTDPRRTARLEERAVSAGSDGYAEKFEKLYPVGGNLGDAGDVRSTLSPLESSQMPIDSTTRQVTVKPRSEHDQEHSEVLRRIRQQLDALSRSVESRLQTRSEDTQEDVAVAPTAKTYTTQMQDPKPVPNLRETGDLGLTDSNFQLKAYEQWSGRETLTPAATGSFQDRVNNGRQYQVESPSVSSLKTAQKIRSLPEGIAELSRSDVAREAEQIMGGRKDRDSFTANKFNRHVRDAETYLAQGRYYKAADSFALAMVYAPDDPQAIIGRSHALFAAGEYMSSALFLSRALTINPEYAKSRVNLVTLMGGPSRLAERIADIEQWIARSGSGRLQFLLGYVYYQTGRIGDAKRAIEAARGNMPQSPAVAAIGAAIDEASVRW